MSQILASPLLLQLCKEKLHIYDKLHKRKIKSQNSNANISPIKHNSNSFIKDNSFINLSDNENDKNSIFNDSESSDKVLIYHSSPFDGSPEFPAVSGLLSIGITGRSEARKKRSVSTEENEIDRLSKSFIDLSIKESNELSKSRSIINRSYGDSSSIISPEINKKLFNESCNRSFSISPIKKDNDISYTPSKKDILLTNKNREKYTNEIYNEFNKNIFESKLSNIPIIWSKTLRSTSGKTKCKLINENRIAEIELSIKVVDNYYRLRKTLLHELCHAAAWIINCYREGHGNPFKSWAYKCNKKYPDCPVSTYHNYSIHYKYRYKCLNCEYIYGRHSKSIDISKQRCGRCNGELIELGEFKRDGTPMKPRILSEYSKYVKENYNRIKEANKDLKAPEIMKILSKEWNNKKKENISENN